MIIVPPNFSNHSISISPVARLTRFEERGHTKVPKGPPFAYVFWKNFQRVPPLLMFFEKISKTNYQRGEYWLFLPSSSIWRGAMAPWPPPLNAPLNIALCIVQILGGWVSSRFGAKQPFGLSIFLSAILSFFIPMAASYDYRAVVGIRILQGVTEVSAHVFKALSQPTEQSPMFVKKEKINADFTLTNDFKRHCG